MFVKTPCEGLLRCSNLHSITLQFTAVAVLGLGKQLIIAGHITVIILFVNTIALVKSKAIEIFIIVVRYLKTR